MSTNKKHPQTYINLSNYPNVEDDLLLIQRIVFETELFKDHPNMEFNNHWKEDIYNQLNSKTLKQREIEKQQYRPKSKNYKMRKMEDHFI